MITEATSKRLTRIRLVNWHFFENETVSLNGTTLISGENTAGKSTILDAIQLILTTNSRKFNLAANEKGNRTLKGYVRCKVGNVGETYHRKGPVPANVALEFYEEKADRYFVLGVHMFSQDEEGPVIRKWYSEECRLEDLSFITDGHASVASEFRNKTRKIGYLETDKAARDKFRHRMGNLDEKFFDIIPKSLAFKPMDNVKQFINKFVLSEGTVDVQGLRSNIETLDELEKTLEKTKKQIASLNAILSKYDEIEKKENDIRINDILLKIAARDALKEATENLAKDIEIKKQTVFGLRERLENGEKELSMLRDKILSLRVDISNNESHKQTENLEQNLKNLEERIKERKDEKKLLEKEAGVLVKFAKSLHVLDREVERQGDIALFLEPLPEEEKAELLSAFTAFFEKEFPQLEEETVRKQLMLSDLDEIIQTLAEQRNSLEKRQLTYPRNTALLKAEIEKEFEKRGITSKVYILSELLEIADERWRDAVEGYFGAQKFYLVVDPAQYDLALEIYDRKRSDIHSAGIINTKKLPQDARADATSLAYVVKSDNRYAKAYTNYLLGRVRRCEKVGELENYDIAITPECMLYQGYVTRHLDPRNYKTPYIGMNAYRVQLENVRKKLEEKDAERKSLRDEHKLWASVVEDGKAVNPAMIGLHMNSPLYLAELQKSADRIKAELSALRKQKDPTLMELEFKLAEVEKERDAKEEDQKQKQVECNRLELQLEGEAASLESGRKDLAERETEVTDAKDRFGEAYHLAENKYKQNVKTKSPQKIVDNFSPQRSQFEREREELVSGNDGLRELQHRYNTAFSMDFTVGTEKIDEYRAAADKLSKVEVVKYEEKLKSAREDCEKIFRSDFLSKMKEYIENAKQEFRNLNKALENVYYGDDSYHFNITFDKRKESLYRMITSEYNMEGGDNNLWTSMFEAEYKDEIEDLFAKLMVGDDKGEKVIEEYTDYRSYLDYDIEIRKKNGQKQRFSDIYGEKSGSETQVPYYVAIAASFYQIYRFGNTVRLMLLDEAFDKMDDDRIESMLEFMNGLGLQLIMATPPQKIEVIGEHVDTILTAIRVGEASIVEEYEL